MALVLSRAAVPASRFAVFGLGGASRAQPPSMAETLVVTDGTDSFYGSRAIFQSLFDYGEFAKITAFSSSEADAKKMLLSRQARYSGLIDVLQFAEGGADALAATLGEASAWIAVNADEAAIVDQVGTASAAGIRRAFIHLSASDAPSVDATKLTAALEASSMEWTVMRTGSLSKKGSGGGLLVSELELPTCDELPMEDCHRFITEAMTITEANGRAFSLCPSADGSQLKQMRLSGCTRRDEVEALLRGQITEQPAEEAAEEKSEDATAEEAVSEKEKKANDEEEIKALLERARVRGIETQKRMKEEEDAKQAKRQERAAYFAQNAPPDDDEKGSDDKKPEEEGEGGDEDKGEEDKGKGGGGGDGDNKPKKDGDDDDDGLALV